MAWLSLPLGRSSVERADFCAWVDAYLKIDSDSPSPYRYVGIDVYAARCAMLHSYGSESDLHRRPNQPKQFGYVDSGHHKAEGDFVLISLAELIRDFSGAVAAFLNAGSRNADLKAQIDSRIFKLLKTMPVKAVQ